MSGGGFFGGAEAGSQGNTSGAKKTIRPIRAIMVSQIHSASLEYGDADGPVVIDEHPVSNAVLCVELLDVSENGDVKRIKVGDSTGTTEIRLPPFVSGTDMSYEDHINKFVNVYGYFRVFAGKPTFDCARLEFEIPPYQFLYHEVEAARESYHYQGLIPLDQSITGANEDPSKVKPEVKDQDSLFVQNSSDESDLKERILGIIRGFEDNGDGVTSEYIASELNINDSELTRILSKLENEALVYEIDSFWRAN